MKTLIKSSLAILVLSGCGGSSDSNVNSSSKEVINLPSGVVTANVDPQTGKYHGSPAVVFEEYADVRNGIVEHRFDLVHGEFVTANARTGNAGDLDPSSDDYYNVKVSIPEGTYGDVRYADDAVSYIRYSGHFRMDDLKGTFSTLIPSRTEDLTTALGKNKWTTPHRRYIDNANQDFIHVLFDKEWIDETDSMDEHMHFFQSKGSYIDGNGYENVYIDSDLSHDETIIYNGCTEETPDICDAEMTKAFAEKTDVVKIVTPNDISYRVTYRVENSLSGEFDQCWLSYSEKSDIAQGQCYNETNYSQPSDTHHTFYVDSNKYPVIDDNSDIRHRIRSFLELESGYTFRDL